MLNIVLIVMVCVLWMVSSPLYATPWGLPGSALIKAVGSTEWGENKPHLLISDVRHGSHLCANLALDWTG